MHVAERILGPPIGETLDLSEHPRARRLQIVGMPGELVQVPLAAVPLPRLRPEAA